MRQVPLPLALWALLLAPGELGAQAPEHHPGRCDPPVRAGPARGGPGRRRRDHRRGPATQRLGGLPSHSVTASSSASDFFSEGAFAGRSGHRAGPQRQHHQPERQHVAFRQHGPLHRLSPRRRNRAAKADQTAAEASLIDARFQQALATTNQFFNALAAGQLVKVRQASVRRAEEQLKVSVNKLQAGSATRSDTLRSRVTLGSANPI